MAYKSFQEMIDTLRAGEAAGMDCTITLKPEGAGYLADILEEHGNRLRAEIEESVSTAVGASRGG